MSKFSKTGTWRPEAAARTNTSSSIRGKISAPIPIQDDDEFPIRSPGTGIATPLGSLTSDGIEKAMMGSAVSGRDSALAQGDVGMGSYIEPPRRMGTSPLPSGRPSYNPSARRTDTTSALRNSSPIPSKPVASKPERKKSTLRGVFGKIFGKKRKDVPTRTRQSADALQSEQHHRSDPTALNRNPMATATSPKRSTSMPVNEFNRALRSHSPFMENFNENNTERDPNRISTQTQSTTTRTRVTTGRLYTPDKTPGYMDWTGLSPRPASSHARGSKVPSDEEGNGLIGMAITSGSHPNRRSRSLGQLREAARAAGGMVRRRSDEIRYWRASYDPGPLSPLSSNKAEAEEPILLNDSESPRPEESRDQPQPFNFGQLSGLTGMKITQAADLETKVNQLESRMIEMEKMVYQIHRRLNGDHVTLQDPPKKGFRRDRSSSTRRPPTDDTELTLTTLPRHRNWQEFGNHHRPASYGRSRPSSSAHNSYHPDFDETIPLPFAASVDDHVPLSTSQPTARPLSTSTTIRGGPASSPTIQKDTPLTMEHYTNLTNMMLSEKAARQHLENVVLSLQQQLASYPLRTSTSYPTPDSATAGGPNIVNTTSKGTFSSFDQDDSDDDVDTESLDPVFQTPNEELIGPNFGDEVFGNVEKRGNVLEVESKDDARTLSLSQITLGKGVQPSMNF